VTLQVRNLAFYKHYFVTISDKHGTLLSLMRKSSDILLVPYGNLTRTT